jgi:hypothetical protein
MRAGQRTREFAPKTAGVRARPRCQVNAGARCQVSGEVLAKLQNGCRNRAASVSERVLAQRCVGLAGHPLADARGSVGANGILQVPQVSGERRRVGRRAGRGRKPLRKRALWRHGKGRPAGPAASRGRAHGKPGRAPALQRPLTCGEGPECGMRSAECGISEKNGSAGASRAGDPSVSARFARGA